jgi:glutathione S-transferase
MKLYGVPQSPFVRKARIVLEEKGLSYEIENPVPGQHPMGKMPVLRDGDVLVPDSSVLAAYLEKTHPSPALYPADPSDYARALFLEEYADTQMSEGMGAIVLERIVKPNVLKQPTDEERLAELLAAAQRRWCGKAMSAAGQPIPSVLDYLEGQLREGHDTVFPRFSIADIALGAHLGWLQVADIELDAKRWPKTARYQHALEGRPSFKATAQAHGQR